jgi:sodium/hydrogen exchanger 8
VFYFYEFNLVNSFYLSKGIFTGRFKQWNLSFFLLCTIFCLVSRLFNTFPLSVVANCFRSRPIPLKMQTVIWFAGLRGAISFALSMQMPGA